MPFRVSRTVWILGLSSALAVLGYGAITRVDSARPTESFDHTQFGQMGAPMREGVQPDTPASRALLKAVSANDLKAVQAAFAKGADPNAKQLHFAHDSPTPQVTTPLLAVVIDRESDGSDRPAAIAIFREFLNRKADMKATTTEGSNAVFWALGLEDVGLVRAVLDAGADPNGAYHLPRGGGNAVHAACNLVLRGKEEKALPLVRLVLEREGNPNGYNADGMTPLHIQSLVGNPGCVALLLKFGADPTLLSKGSKTPQPGGIPTGWSALQFARRGGNEEVINLLLAARKKTGGRLSATEAATVGDVNALREHLKSGMNPRGTAEDGTPFLILAAASGKEEAVRLLLDNGANPNVVGKNQTTALMRSAVLGYPKIVHLLLERNADPNWVRIPQYPGVPQPPPHQMPETALLAAIRAAEPEVVAVLAASKRLNWNAPGNREALLLSVETAAQMPPRPIGKDPTRRKKGDALLTAQDRIYEIIVSHMDMRQYGGPALAAAANEGQFGLAEDLLRRGANPNGVNRTGTTVLIATVDSIGMARDDAKTMDVPDATPAERKKLQQEIADREKAGMGFLRLLLARRPDVNATAPALIPGEKFNTALTLARLGQMKDVERLLIKAGAKR